MIFSRLSRSLSRYSRSRVSSLCISCMNMHQFLLFLWYFFSGLQNAISGVYSGRLANWSKEIFAANGASKNQLAGELGLLRGYLATIRTSKEVVPKQGFSDLNHVFANPRLRRFFSSEAPKKKSESFLCLVHEIFQLDLHWFVFGFLTIFALWWQNMINMFPKRRRTVRSRMGRSLSPKVGYLVILLLKCCYFLDSTIGFLNVNELWPFKLHFLVGYHIPKLFMFLNLPSEETNSGDHSNFQETLMRLFQNFPIPLLALWLAFMTLSFNGSEAEQEVGDHMLEYVLNAYYICSVNQSSLSVYVFYYIDVVCVFLYLVSNLVHYLGHIFTLQLCHHCFDCPLLTFPFLLFIVFIRTLTEWRLSIKA